MSRRTRTLIWSCLLLVTGCQPATPEEQSPGPTSLSVRAQRRAFAGAPPVIPHPSLTGTCTTCHTPEGGRIVTNVGIAPANPHTKTPGMSAESRCKQCHVFRNADDLFVVAELQPWHGGGTYGERAYAQAPPTIPHPQFMHEDCSACHSGPAARPEIVCSHAERIRCQQCHVGRDAQASDSVLVDQQFTVDVATD